jgi:hypothetical protein
MMSLRLGGGGSMLPIIPAYGTSHDPYIEGLDSRKIPSHICRDFRRCNLVNLPGFVVSAQVVAHTSACNVGVVLYMHIEV